MRAFAARPFVIEGDLAVASLSPLSALGVLLFLVSESVGTLAFFAVAGL